MITDLFGRLTKFTITLGQRGDATQAQALLTGINGANVLADKAYDSDAIRSQLVKQKCTATIPSKINRIQQFEFDKQLYKQRYRIECFFNKLKQFRRVFSRFDKSLHMYSSYVALAASILWLH